MGKPGGRSPASRAKRREAWKQRQLQLSTWNHEQRQQLQQQQQQQRLLIEKDRKDADKVKNYAVRFSQKARAQLIELEKQRTRQEKVPPSPRLSPRTCPFPSSLLSPPFVLCAAAG